MELIMNSLPKELRKKLDSSDPEIKNYVFQLVKENLKLQRDLAKYQVENTSLKNRIIVLQKNGYRPQINVNTKGIFKKQNNKDKQKNNK